MKKKTNKKKNLIKKTKKKISKTTKKKLPAKKKTITKKKNNPKLNKKKSSFKGQTQKSIVNFSFPEIESTIKKNSFIIPFQSKTEGEVNNHTVIVQGQFNGTIKSDEVYILNGSKITGEIITNKITIYGNCHANIHAKSLCIIKNSGTVKGDINYDGNLSIEVGGKVFGSLIPKKKPLALPNYTNNNKSEPSLISEEFIENDTNYQPVLRQNNFNKKNKSLDGLINKIFK